MTHPLAEYAAPIVAAIQNDRKKEGKDLELELITPCWSMSPPRADGNGEDFCHYRYNHEGPCSWQRRKP